jgi:hypothetical protein
MGLATIAGTALTAELKPQLGLLVGDMRDRLSSNSAEVDRWREQHREAVAEDRTAEPWTDWCDDQLTQAAVGWLLTSVFVRFCEDNLLLGESAVWITSPDPILRQHALDAENAFYQAEHDKSYREWLEVAFIALRNNHVTAPLVDEHAAIRIISPSSDAVNQLLQFWRRIDDDGNLLWRFNDPELSTRFLGDIYQDLSDYAREKYSLFQTPEFIEEFILDQTLIPALKDRPLEGLKLIDPTCGSGHFLLGAFKILVDRWHHEAPGLETRARVDKALESIYGVDINPFAVAIAMFRLIVGALKETGDRSFVNAPGFTLNLASGDSLLHGPDSLGRKAFDYKDEIFDKDAVASKFSYRTEDVPKLRKFLALGQYDVVVGNPPYPTVKDKALNARYRELYRYCKAKYALSVPFMERFFQLAEPGERAGWVGQITSNSFMTRHYGVPLIEKFLSEKDLRLIADTSGVYLPGHGTPTVILVGRNHGKIQETVRSALGIQGEPGTPENPAKGKVWTDIVDHIDHPGYESQWISVTDLPREQLAKHPWSLTGGGAVELSNTIDLAAQHKISDVAAAVGITAVTGEDDLYIVETQANAHRLRIAETMPLVEGSDVRDWSRLTGKTAIWTYTDDFQVKCLESLASAPLLWSYRSLINRRKRFGTPMLERGLTWYEWQELYAAKLSVQLSITFAFVATHNHFVLDRGGKVFNRTAPVIKLPTAATEDDHLRLLGTLNSSTACFWLKQNCFDKGRPGAEAAGADEPWEHRFEFGATTLQEFPFSANDSLDRARRIDSLAQQLTTSEPAAAIASEGARTAAIERACIKYARIRGVMIAEQEELDWETYYNYGLIKEELFLAVGKVPEISSAERAFAIALARRVAAGGADTSWFTHHNHRFTPVVELPEHWPAQYRQLVEKRLAAIESNSFIRLLEKPEYKRRWARDPWDVELSRALKDWLLDKLENRSLWFTAQETPQPLSVGELAGHVEKDAEFITAMDLWAGQKDAPVARALGQLLADQVVPYLAAFRYKESGLRKRAEWEHVWSLQRDEDAGLIKAADIPVPPKYTGADFVKQSYWSHRGKLDVPKERFIVYPGAGRATDPTPLLGWAGWNHAQQGVALATIYTQRESEGTALAELVPVVAGIAEVLPWVKQWHSGIDPVFNIDLAEYLSAQLAEKSAAVGVPITDLAHWRPTKTTARRRRT